MCGSPVAVMTEFQGEKILETDELMQDESVSSYEGKATKKSEMRFKQSNLIWE